MDAPNSLHQLNHRFGGTVRKLRKERGWTQEALAERADLDRSFLGEIERGHAVSSLHTIVKLAKAFEQTPGTLLHDLY